MCVELPWICPVCGGTRGTPYPTKSYDGSRYLYCNGWENPCGHIDKYSDVRDEYNRLNSIKRGHKIRGDQ